MTAGTAVFTCSICGEPSSEICAYCTKDACRNHRCDRCKRCSDCCECEEPLSAADVAADPVEAPAELAVDFPEAAPAVEAMPETQEEPAAEDNSHDSHSGEGIVS